MPPISNCHPVAASRFAGTGARFVSTTPVANDVGTDRSEQSDAVEVGMWPDDDETDADRGDGADHQLERSAAGAG